MISIGWCNYVWLSWWCERVMCHMTLRGVGLKTHLKHAQLRVIHAAIAVHTKEMDYTLHDPSFIGLWWCDRPGRNDSTVCTKTYMNDSYSVFQWSFRLCEVTPTHPFLMWQSLACMFLNSPTMEGFWLVVEREGEGERLGLLNEQRWDVNLFPITSAPLVLRFLSCFTV